MLSNNASIPTFDRPWRASLSPPSACRFDSARSLRAQTRERRQNWVRAVRERPRASLRLRRPAIKVYDASSTRRFADPHRRHHALQGYSRSRAGHKPARQDVFGSSPQNRELLVCRYRVVPSDTHSTPLRPGSTYVPVSSKSGKALFGRFPRADPALRPADYAIPCMPSLTTRPCCAGSAGRGSTRPRLVLLCRAVA